MRKKPSTPQRAKKLQIATKKFTPAHHRKLARKGHWGGHRHPSAANASFSLKEKVLIVFIEVIIVASFLVVVVVGKQAYQDWKMSHQIGLKTKITQFFLPPQVLAQLCPSPVTTAVQDINPVLAQLPVSSPILQSALPSSPSADLAIEPVSVVVEKNDNFWKIAERVCQNGKLAWAIQEQVGYKNKALHAGEILQIQCE